MDDGTTHLLIVEDPGAARDEQSWAASCQLEVVCGLCEAISYVDILESRGDRDIAILGIARCVSASCADRESAPQTVSVAHETFLPLSLVFQGRIRENFLCASRVFQGELLENLFGIHPDQHGLRLLQLIDRHRLQSKSIKQ
eukprot:gnl/TRDRNA2_/TRDRNA2_206892_c0_seq1.p1 gnl/TRDRNA2_/TRDRNA2_206892_c0~~gnl/TRDRNA2_/TRDRNA2_206892_c0_seq1.p1  ORF type:complete len:142 (-),score=3.61 gnl/TRDRNA2_/TRDRNA2_206892_c0_seq1:297-722(-)